MRFSFRDATMLIVFGVLAAATIFLGVYRGAPPTVERSDHITEGIAGPIRARPLPLTDEQRSRIFDQIMKIRGVPVAHIAPPSLVPNSVDLQELPPGVASAVPMAEGYKFVKLDDWILLVDPTDRSVVARMPRYKIILD